MAVTVVERKNSSANKSNPKSVKRALTPLAIRAHLAHLSSNPSFFNSSRATAQPIAGLIAGVQGVWSSSPFFNAERMSR